MARVVVVLSLVMALSSLACKRHHARAPEDDEQAAPAAGATGSQAAGTVCRSNAQCANGWACLDNKCVDPSSAALYTHPSNAVTPDKVKREVEHQVQVHQQQLDDKTLHGVE